MAKIIRVSGVNRPVAHYPITQRGQRRHFRKTDRHDRYGEEAASTMPACFKAFARPVLSVGLALMGGLASASAPTAADLLKQADRSRGHLEVGLTYNVKMHCTDADGTTDRTFVVRSHGENAIAEATSPEDHKGDIYLVNGRVIWDLRATTKQPVAVTLQSRLTGLASVGDIVAMGFSTIYDGVIAREESLAGNKAQVLELTGKKGQAATYESALMWVDSKSKVALQAQFLSVAKRPIKTITFAYNNSLKVKGKSIPFVTESVISDDLSKCVINYLEPKLVSVDKAVFNLDKIVAAKVGKP